MSVLTRSNNVLDINHPTGVGEALSLAGSDWVWAVTAVYIVSFLVLLSLCFTAPESNRVFHYLYTMALLVGAVTSFAQASDLGWTAVTQPDNGPSRQIFFTRYINWVVAFPSVALSLGLLSNISWVTIILNIFICWFWALTYLAGAYTTTVYKWGFFAFGTLSWLILAMSTLNECRESAERIGIGRDYMFLAAYANLLWIVYPIAWAVADGGDVLNVTGAAALFGVLDVLMLPVLGFAFVFLGRNWDYGALCLAFSDYRSKAEAMVGVKNGTATDVGQGLNA